MDPRPSFLQLLGDVTSLWRHCSDRLAGVEDDAPLEAAVRRLQRTTRAIAGARPAARPRLAR